ncbi:MAG: hypothetical protein WDO68_22965 [Gammaproteobacteria bacterium]
MRIPLGSLFIAAATLTVSLAAAAPALAQDDIRVRQLENEVLRLQREIDTQNQRIERLESSTRSPGSLPPVVVTPRAADSSPSWLVSTNWDKLRTGMKELDVIALLGRPTSVRSDDGARTHTMFYAIELGPNAFLTGNVRFGDAGVAEINRPTLR